MSALSSHPETATLGLVLAPYRAMASQPEDLVDTLDLLARMWQEAKAP